MSRIAILGARGFVGKNLVEHLTGKHTVFAITRNEIDLLDEISARILKGAEDRGRDKLRKPGWVEKDRI